MVTTTAFVSGLSCVELVKLAQSVPLTLHRNAFINLALPFFAFTVPLPAERMPGLKGEAYTLWDRFDIREGKKSASTGGLTVRSLIRQLKKKVASDPESVEVSSIGCGSYMLYASFLHGDDSSVLDTPLWELIQDAVDADDIADAREDEKQEQTSVIDCSSFIDLAVVIEDLESGDEVELPPVRVTRYVPSAK
jgi:ubiquitin-activating enzyme E1